MSDVTNDRLILHLLHVLSPDDVEISGSRDVDVTPTESIFHGENAETFHRGLESADGIDFGHHNLRTLGPESLCTTFAHITITADDSNLARNHHVRGTLNSVDQRLTATIEVIELRLRHRIIHINGRKEKLPVTLHLVEAMNPSRGLLGNTFQLGNPSVENTGLFSVDIFKQRFDHSFFSRRGRFVDPIRSIFKLIPFVDEKGSIATIINNQLGSKWKATIRVRKLKSLPGAPPVFFEGFTLPCKNRITSLGHRSSGVILG